MRRALLVTVGLFLLGSATADAADPVVIDDWWNIDFAKSECKLPQKRDAESCAVDAEQEVRSYVLELTTQMAASPQCAGVSVVTFAGPKKPSTQVVNDAATKPHWNLSINFTSGKHKQQWQMLHTDPDHLSYTKGESDPKELAKTVCGIVRGKGAKILN